MKHGVRLFEVGGCVRDEILGVQSKDIDFAVEAPSFAIMKRHIEHEGLKIFQTKEEFLTIRAGVPKGHKLRERCKDADFVLCRKDGPTVDGRRPEFVEAGTILDDLARRDFTVNAIARCVETGELLDPHGGRADLEARKLRFVGNAADRIDEDGLRILRGLRFSLTKGLRIADEDHAIMESKAEMLASVSTERISDELNKMFVFDTLKTLIALQAFSHVRATIFARKGLSMEATMRKRR